jgi:hypothetical protein
MKDSASDGCPSVQYERSTITRERPAGSTPNLMSCFDQIPQDCTRAMLLRRWLYVQRHQPSQGQTKARPRQNLVYFGLSSMGSQHRAALRCEVRQAGEPRAMPTLCRGAHPADLNLRSCPVAMGLRRWSGLPLLGRNRGQQRQFPVECMHAALVRSARSSLAAFHGVFTTLSSRHKSPASLDQRHTCRCRLVEEIRQCHLLLWG